MVYYDNNSTNVAHRICLDKSYRNLEYTGRNPVPSLGLFCVLVILNGYSGTSSLGGGADQPLGRNFTLNKLGNWRGSKGIILCSIPILDSTRDLAGFFLNNRFTCVLECLNRTIAAWCCPATFRSALNIILPIVY